MATIHDQMTIISVQWFSEMGNPNPIGIVLAEYNDTKVRKAFIGTASGLDENQDALYILERGAKFYQSQVQKLNNELLVKQ